MENPVVRRKSLEITNAPKLSVFGNSKTTPPNEHTLSSRSQDSCEINKSATSQPVEMTRMNYPENAACCPTSNNQQGFHVARENGHHPLGEFPENLSLKRRYSVEVPVDLRKKTLNAARDKERKSAPAPSSKPANGDNGELTHEALLLAAMRGEIPSLDKELSALLNSTKRLVTLVILLKFLQSFFHILSQKTISDTTHHHKKILRELEVNCLIKTALLVSKVKELQVLQKQSFNLDVMDNWLQGHRELDAAMKDDSILINIRREAQKILMDVCNDMFNKAEQLFGSKFNADDLWKLLGKGVVILNGFHINSFHLGRSDPQGTNRLPPNLEEIHHLRNLNLNDHPPIENILTEPHNYRQHVYTPPPNVYPHQEFNQIPLRPNENTEKVVYLSYQPQKVKLPPRMGEDSRPFPPYIAMHPRENKFLANGDKDHGAVKKNLPRPRSKSHRNLEVQNGVQPANLKRSLSNPHNSNLDYPFMFHPPPHEIVRMAPQLSPQEPVFYPRCLKTIPGTNYIQGVIPDKNVKQYRNSYPPEPYAVRHPQPPVPNGKLEPQKVCIVTLNMFLYRVYLN